MRYFAIALKVLENEEQPALPVETQTGWTGGDVDAEPVTYDVYLEKDNPAPETLICDDIPISICVPPTLLEPGAQYFWRVIASDGQGLSSEGKVWDFMTIEGDPGALIFKNSFE